jgi:aminobenzoyl-glutamate utilization protein B
MILLNKISRMSLLLLGAVATPIPALALAPPAVKQAAMADVDANAKLVQVMVDTVFSFGEPGFQEYRTSDYLTGILARNGFKITRGISGIPPHGLPPGATEDH